jgi:hypothetical protein
LLKVWLRTNSPLAMTTSGRRVRVGKTLHLDCDYAAISYSGFDQ